MKKALVCTGLALVVIALIAIPAQAKKAQTGNGAPSGADYNLQVIAFDNCPAGDFTGSNRHEIAVLSDFNSGVCSNDEYQGCDTNGDCSGGTCIDIGYCSNNTSQACTSDADCDTGQTGDLSIFCAAGPLPSGDPSTINRTNKIYLVAGDDFQVIDGNACDSDGATFQLPTEPVACSSGLCAEGPDAGDTCTTSADCAPLTNLSVWIRLVGKPHSKIGVTLCATAIGTCDTGTGFCNNDPTQNCASDGDCPDNLVCSSDNVIAIRTNGHGSKPQFSDVTSELLTMTVCTDSTGCTHKGDLTTVAIFDSDFYDFFWNWNTQGRPHAQLKFYYLTD